MKRLHRLCIKVAAFRKAVLFALALQMCPLQADAETVVLKRGLIGGFVARMDVLADAFRRRGDKVIVTAWDEPTPKADLVVGHSLGAHAALASHAKRIITIDPPLAADCPQGSRCVNFSGLARINGATNISVTGIPHTVMPDRLANRIVAAGASR